MHVDCMVVHIYTYVCGGEYRLGHVMMHVGNCIHCGLVVKVDMHLDVGRVCVMYTCMGELACVHACECVWVG